MRLRIDAVTVRSRGNIVLERESTSCALEQCHPRILEELDADVVYALTGLVPTLAAHLAGTISNVNNMFPFRPTPGRQSPMVSGDRFPSRLPAATVCPRSQQFRQSTLSLLVLTR